MTADATRGSARAITGERSPVDFFLTRDGEITGAVYRANEHLSMILSKQYPLSTELSSVRSKAPCETSPKQPPE